MALLNCLTCFEDNKVNDNLIDLSDSKTITPCVIQFRSEERPDQEISIIKQLLFSSTLLRMSFLCKSLCIDCLDVYTKGAPENINELCRPDTSKNN